MQQKSARIFESAKHLFDEIGYEAVTTQQIADRADVAAGTLFRYAASKAELLLMVYNQVLRSSIEEGNAAAHGAATPTGKILALIEPTLHAGDQRSENTIAYQRELLFGTAVERYRREGIELVMRLERLIAQILTRGEPNDASMKAARSVFGVVHLALAQPSTGVWAETDRAAGIKTQVAQIVAGYYAVASPDN